jgi:hypothetical protein
MPTLCQIILDPYDVRFVFDDLTEIYAEKYFEYQLSDSKKIFELNFDSQESYISDLQNLNFVKLIGKEVLHQTQGNDRVDFEFSDGSWLSIRGLS